MGRCGWLAPSSSACAEPFRAAPGRDGRDAPDVSWEEDALLSDMDAFRDDELEPSSLWAKFAQSLRKGGVLHPQSCWHLAWLLLVSACFMYNCISIPLRSTFPYETAANWWTWFAVDRACDAVYLLDLALVKPHVIFLDDGFWVRDKRRTRRHYFKKWQFGLDIVSLAPLDLVLLRHFNVLFRLPRILKIQTFWELFDHLDSLHMSPYLVRVARTLCYMMFLVHLNACGYYAFSAREGLGTNNWTFKGGDGNAYIRCFYFATKTATSVGKNPRPETEGEYLFMTCSWLMGVFVFALLIGQIRDIVATASRTRTEHRKRLDETLEHMRGLSLPPNVQRRVMSWFSFADQHQPFDEAKILNSLPQKLKTDVALDVHGGTLDKVHLFQQINDKALIRDLVLKLRSVLYLPGDYICHKGEVGKEMYIVKTGQVEVLAPTNGEVLATLGEGSVFGEISLLALAGGNRRTADVRSKGFSNLFVLSKNDLHETLVYYPDAQRVLKIKAEQLMKENAEREQRENDLARGSPSPPAGTSGSARCTPETSSPSSPESATEAVVLEAGPGGRWPRGAEVADGLLPSVRVTQATDQDSDLTDVTCASLTSRSSRTSRTSRTSRSSRSSRRSGRGSCCSCSCRCVTCSSSCCSCSCSQACAAVVPPTPTDTALATAPPLPWAADPVHEDADDAGTLSDLSSASLLSPLLSPTHEWVHDLQRRRVSAPTPATEATDGSLLVPHRLSFPSSRRKAGRGMSQRSHR